MLRDVKVPKKFEEYLDCEPEYFEDDFILFEDYLVLVDKRRKADDPRTDAEFMLNEFHMFEKFRKQEMRKAWKEDQRNTKRQRKQPVQLKRSKSPVSIGFLMLVIEVRKLLLVCIICNVIFLFRK